MAANGLVTVEAARILNDSIEASSTVDLVTTMGTASAAPTKVTGGSYAAQTPTWNTTSTASKHNTADVTFSGLPAVASPGIVGVDVANTTPARTWFSPFASGIVTASGDSITFAATTGLVFSLTNGT